MMMAKPPRRFLITGVSRGLGAAFAQAALAAGHHVVGTVRDAEQAAAFSRLAPGRSHAVLLDLMDICGLDDTVQRAESFGGPIDILVNNAGYGQEGPVEESPLEALRAQFEVNVIAPVVLIRAILPSMRSRRSGHIVNVTSMAGTTGFPGLSYYCASKFALEGLSESLGKELRPLGIFVTAFAPGQFRTDWAGRSLHRTERSIADYDASFDPIRSARLAKNGRQPGDPARAAKALMAIVDADAPPARLFVGTDAMMLATQKMKRTQAEMAAWDTVARSTDFPTKA